MRYQRSVICSARSWLQNGLWAFLLIPAQWLSDSCSAKPCSAADLLLNPKHLSLDKTSAKGWKLRVYKWWSHPFFTEVNKSHLLCTAFCFQQEGRVHTLLYNAASSCGTKDWQGCGIRPTLSFQTCYDNTNTKKLRALTLLSNSEPKHLEKQVQQTTWAVSQGWKSN